MDDQDDYNEDQFDYANYEEGNHDDGELDAEEGFVPLPATGAAVADGAVKDGTGEEEPEIEADGDLEDDEMHVLGAAEVAAAAVAATANAQIIIRGKDRKLRNIMTRYVYTRLITVRIAQLNNDSPPMYETDEEDSWKIAEEEMRRGILPLFILRPLPDDNSKFEEWSPSEMKLPIQ
jgi:DNA-directed RNA polymerase subunit K/omega